MLRSVRFTVVLAALALAAPLVGCGDDTDETSTPGTAAPVSYPLPFGLTAVEGTESVGRPIVERDTLLVYDGAPIAGTSFTGVYRVAGGNPIVALQAWVDQLAALGTVDQLAGGQRTDGDPSDAWAGMSGYASASGPSWATASAELWATSTGDLLLITASQADGLVDDGVPTAIRGELDPSLPRPEELRARDLQSGDVLFDVGDAIHVPADAHVLMPTLPTTDAYFGSTSLLAAEEPRAALQAMLDEATSQNDYYESDPIAESEFDGVRILTASFVIPAGGWGFDAVAVQGPDDAEATILVTSASD